MADTNRLTLSASTARTPLSPAVRNNIYSALTGQPIQRIAQTLEHELATSGFTSNLKAYITHLLRSGECTSLDEVTAAVFAKMQNQIAELSNGANGTNGTNGAVSVNGKEGDDEWDLHIGERAIREGVKVVRRELEAVCDIKVEGDDK
jgi:hypothetical protein